jgi:hypothetical protein
LLLEQIDQHLGGRRLARTRSATDDRHLPLERRGDRAPLIGLQLDAALGLGSPHR